MNIGNWVRRKGGKYHVVESIIDGAAITKCGRRMEARTGDGGLQVSDVMPLTRMIGQPQLCKGGCDNGKAPAFVDDATGGRLVAREDIEDFHEDDGSTANEVADA